MWHYVLAGASFTATVLVALTSDPIRIYLGFRPARKGRHRHGRL